MLIPAAPAHAATPIPLGVADSFALLAGSTITNTGATTIIGDIGLCCTGIATTGFGPGADEVNQPAGAQYVGTGAAAARAQDDLDIAYGNAAGQAVTNTVPVDLSLSGTPANPLLPGVYESTAHGALQINTGLTLDFQGDPNAVFIFQGTSLSTAVGVGGSVSIVNGGATPSTCNIYWQLSDATQGVTLGTGSALKGTTMSLGASVLGVGATVEGRILSRRSRAVNLHTNTITRTACFTPAPIGGTPAPGSTTATPPTAAIVPSRRRPGTVHLSGPSRPVSGPFTVSAVGHRIQSVAFYVDGRLVGTVAAVPGRTKFKLTIDPRRQSRRLHRVVARVRFTRASGTPSTTRRLAYRRVLARPATRFTG
ncbi:MAG TPA: ice-binding family protein [Solirubrobacteraceae bacterium]|nr:ice-binding family protein [Solirubrobacteraceae bacterium]